MADASTMLRKTDTNPGGLPLLTMKLYIPRPRATLVHRPRLIARLNAALSHPLTLVAAPAGFGKTTLLATWAQETQLPVAWVALDAGDNDPVRFWSYVLAALEQLYPEVGQRILPLLQAPQPPPLEAVLTVLLNEVAALPTSLALVLDDYHVITALPIHQALTFLVDHLPPTLHLLLATRSDPPLPLARWRARGQLSELRAADLRFTAEEAATFLREAMGLSLSKAEVAALEARTEGWIVGLHLAALSLQGHEDLHGFIRAFTGSHRHIVDYLITEVLQRQSEAVQAFLLRTAILERLSAPLCDAVTRQSDSQTMLEGLERANLFLIPLDEERHWYRYHHLFAEVLRARLLQMHPDLVPSLHGRAATWYQDHGYVADAIVHILAAHDWGRAMGLIAQVAHNMLKHGEVSTLRTWLEALPDELLRSHPQLCLDHAWTLVIMGALDAVEPRLRIVEQLLDVDSMMQDPSPGNLPPKQQEMVGDIAAIRAAMAIRQGDPDRAIAFCRQALTRLPEHVLVSHSVVAMYLGDAYSLLGNLKAAQQAYAEFMTLSRKASSRYLSDLALNRQALVEVRLGHLQTAATIYRQELIQASEQGREVGVVTGDAHISMGRLLYEWNDLDNAAYYLEQGIEFARQYGSTEGMAAGYARLALVKHACGDDESADSLLTQAEQLAAIHTRPRLAAELAARRVHLWLMQGNLAAAARWAQEYGLNLDQESELLDPYLRDFMLLTLARVHIAQGKPDEALGLLERLLQAAEAAERMGVVIESLILKALALQAQGELAQAITSLERALALAEPEGYVRIFADEGRPMAVLLQRAAEQGIAPSYVRTLLATFPRTEEHLPGTSIPSHPEETRFLVLEEPLTARELEVLRLLAAGLSYPEIAQHFVVSINTVKTQVKSIYGKLDVHSRAEAIAKARALQLLP